MGSVKIGLKNLMLMESDLMWEMKFHTGFKRIREHVRSIKPDIYLLGEIWHDASQWLMGDEYDSVMNYPLMSGIHDFFWTSRIPKKILNI